MNKKLVAITFFIIILIIVGCVNLPKEGIESSNSLDDTPLIAASQTSSISTTDTINTTITPTTTQTPVPPTPSVTPSVTATPTVTTIMPESRCLEILPDFPADFAITGQLILQDPKILGGAYTQDMTTGASLPIPENKNIPTSVPNDFTVAPNAEWVVYIDVSWSENISDAIVISSADRADLISYPTDVVKFADPYYWLDNEWVVFRSYNHNGLDRPIMLNPFTGEKQELIPDYPDIISDDYIYWGWPSITIYDPTLSRVVYVGEGKNYTDKLVLWDRNASQSIVEIPNLGFSYNPPQWNPKGEQFVYVKTTPEPNPKRRNDELVLVSWEGKITQITHLSDHYEESKIFSLSWSPNGQYIAFWVNRSLAIVDVETGKITNFCIQTTVNDPRAPIWSPESKYIAIETVDEDGLSRTVVVSVEATFAFYLAENVFPAGWMIQSP